MKDGDTQELNPMEDPPKENEESQALVADGDSKRPKSEVGTNDKMFKKEHERTPEEEKEIYVQRQINQRNAPGEHLIVSTNLRLRTFRIAISYQRLGFLILFRRVFHWVKFLCIPILH